MMNIGTYYSIDFRFRFDFFLVSSFIVPTPKNIVDFYSSGFGFDFPCGSNIDFVFNRYLISVDINIIVHNNVIMQ